jgi:L-alanine-DL-glutamate epimerase-like enolase superfamily enzyme
MHRAKTHGERVFVYRIELEDGSVGWGEARLDRGDRAGGLEGRNALGVIHDRRAGFGFQMAAVDAVGRACGLPAWRLLGTKRRKRVKIAWWDIDMPPEDLAAEMAEAVSRGYTSAKLKPRPWRDLIAQLDAIEKVVPEGFTVNLDFNGMLLDAEQALAFLKRIDERPVVGGYESPFYLQNDTDGARRLTEAMTKRTVEHFNPKVLHARAADGFVVASNYMPLDRTTRLDSQCAAFDRPYWLQMVGTGITTAFMAHLGAVHKYARWPAITCHELWEDDLLAERIEVKDGTIAVPAGPGLGVTVDTEAIARYRVEGPDVPTPKERYLERPRTIRIHIPPAGQIGTGPDDFAPEGKVLEFGAEKEYYHEFLKGRYPGFRPGTRLEVIER